MPYTDVITIRNKPNSAVPLNTLLLNVLNNFNVQPEERILVVTAEHFICEDQYKWDGLHPRNMNSFGGPLFLPNTPQAFPKSWNAFNADLETIEHNGTGVSCIFPNCMFIINGVTSCDHDSVLGQELRAAVQSWQNVQDNEFYPLSSMMTDKQKKEMRIRAARVNTLLEPSPAYPYNDKNRIKWIADISFFIKNALRSDQKIIKQCLSGNYGGDAATTSIAYDKKHGFVNGGFGSIEYLSLTMPETIQQFCFPQVYTQTNNENTRLKITASGSPKSTVSWQPAGMLKEEFILSICGDAGLLWNTNNLVAPSVRNTPVIIQGDIKTPSNLFAQLFQPDVVLNPGAAQWPNTIIVTNNVLPNEKLNILNSFSRHGILFADQDRLKSNGGNRRVSGAYYRCQQIDNVYTFTKQDYARSYGFMDNGNITNKENETTYAATLYKL